MRDSGFMEQVQGVSAKEYGMRHSTQFDKKVNTLQNLMGDIEGLQMPELFTAEYRRELVAPLRESLRYTVDTGAMSFRHVESSVDEYDRVFDHIEDSREEFVYTIVKNYVKMEAHSGFGNSRRAVFVKRHASELSRVLKQYYYDFKAAEKRLMYITRDEWRPRLNAVREMIPGLAYRHYSLCASVSLDFDFLDKRSDAISASIITESKLDLYGCDERVESCRLGWVFSPEVEEILGMAPVPDDGSELERNAGYLGTNIFYCLPEAYNRFVSAQSSTDGRAFLWMYPYEKFIERTEAYNEVILQGNTKPFAIFALKTVCSEPELVNKVNVLATVLSMPVVCLDREEGTATLLQQLTAEG